MFALAFVEWCFRHLLSITGLTKKLEKVRISEEDLKYYQVRGLRVES